MSDTPLSTTISADIRARSTYLPYCPCCSFPSQQLFTGPSHREFRGRHKLDGCCAWSTNLRPGFASQAEAAQWWRARRMETLPVPALDNRRLLSIARLLEAGLEAIEFEEITNDQPEKA